MSIDIKKIKDEIKKSGASKGKFLYFREDEKVRIHFLQEIDEGLEVVFHDSFKLGVNVPCQEVFGRECEYCEDDDLRTRSMYIWSVYEYESDEVKLLMAAVNNCSPVPSLLSLFESYGTIMDRDYEIVRRGKGQNTTYSVIPLKERKFRNTKAKPLSEQAVLKYIDKAYPADNSDVDEEEKSSKKKKKGSKAKNTLKGRMNEPEEPEDEWEDEEEEEKPDYSDMSPKELYKICCEKGIDCKPKKKKEYYLELLEDDEGEEQEDEWEDEEEELPFV